MRYFLFLIIAAIINLPVNIIMAQEYETIMEDFNDNSRNWLISSGDAVSKVEDGMYKLSSTGKSTYIFKSYLPIDNNNDYSIEIKMRQTGGAQDYGYGICWGYETTDDYYYFNVSTNKFVTVKGYKADVKKVYLDWTEQKKKTINPIGEYNILRIDKDSKGIKYYVNDKEVASTTDIKYVGTYIGVMTSTDMTAEVDYIKIKRKKQVLNLVANPKNGFVLENMGANVNSKYTEKSPLISPDGNALYFAHEGNPTNLGGTDKSDIFSSTLNPDNNTWSKAERNNSAWNNKGHNFLISISPDGNTALLGNTYNADGSSKGAGVSVSIKRNGVWSLPEKQEIIGYSNDNKYVTFFLSNDGLHLFMSIEKSGGYGDTDLYVSDLQDDGKWSTPKNLGSRINTYASEFAPFLAPDGRTLYFTSDGLQGYGSCDIYVTKRLDDSWTSWSEPENLGPEINGPDWDAYYNLSAQGDYAYMVANNDNSLGGTDLYRIKIGESNRPDPVTMISGKTYNKKTGELINADIVYEDLSSAKKLGVAFSTKEDGFKLALPKGGNYGFRAEANGFIPVSENIDLTKLESFAKKEVKLYLVPIEKGQVVRLNNIFFDYDKATLTTDSYAELDRLVTIMKENAEMRIEVGGHTDDKGSDDYNQKLSQSRSESVRAYLLSKGIDKSRLTAKGYGESKPAASNDTEEGQQYNRRVEIAIL